MRRAPNRVMVIEDSPTQAERLRALFEREGMEVVHAPSAEAAVDMFVSARPDLVVLDYHLPGMSGHEFARQMRLKLNTRAIPILMLTVEGGEAAEARGLESGADDYLEKSADPDVLLARARALLRKSDGVAPIFSAAEYLARPRLLIVSGSPTFREFLARELKPEHYEIEGAADDAAASERIAHKKADCVLIDCAGWGGAVWRERIAAWRVRVGWAAAILLLVEGESKEEMTACIEAGADDCTLKSIDFGLLRARVRALVRRKMLLDENRRIAEELARKEVEAAAERAQKEAAELRATMTDRLRAANDELQDTNRRLNAALEVTRAITDHAAEALFLLDSDGRIVFVNPAASKIFGYGLEDLLGQPFHDILHQHPAGTQAASSTDCPLARAIAQRAAVVAHDDLFFRKDGSRVDVAYSTSPITDEVSRTGAVVVVHDVSEHKRAEERLRYAQKLESIGLLAGGIAHDFNNLLVGIIGNASLATELIPTDHPAHATLEGIIKSGEVAAHLTRQLLAYAGKGRFILKAVNISSLARDAHTLIESSISKKITFSKRLDPDLPAVKSDPAQIQQILMNLVLNAAEAIGDNPGIIAVATGAADLDAEQARTQFPGWNIAPGRYVFLEVRDTGSGMDSATQARIFDPFFTTKFHGRGLGLAAVAGIVRGNGGAIEVQSTPGAGTTFRVWLPAATGVSQRSDPPADPTSEELRGEGTILLVDDESFVRDVASKGLERRGYKVLAAESGRAAIDLMRAHSREVRAIILDLSMPGMSGQEALPRLREINPDVKILISSGHSETDALRLFDGARVSAFLQKPYTAQELARKLKAVLEPSPTSIGS